VIIMTEKDANLMQPGKAYVPVGSMMEQHKHGGEGSGNFGHEGRPGEVGGSGEGGGSAKPESGSGGANEGKSEGAGTGYSTRGQHTNPPATQKDVSSLATRYPTDLYEGRGEYGKPHGIVSVSPNDPDNAKIAVEHSFDIKDDLKGRSYKFNGDSKTWDKSGTVDDIKKEVDYLNGKGGSSHIRDGQSLGVTALVKEYGPEGVRALAGKVPKRDILDSIDKHAERLGLSPKLPIVGPNATKDEKLFVARWDYND